MPQDPPAPALPAHLHPSPPGRAARAALWQLPLAVGLTLAALLLVGRLAAPCDRDPDFARRRPSRNTNPQRPRSHNRRRRLKHHRAR